MDNEIDSYHFDVLKKMYDQCMKNLQDKVNLPNNEKFLFFYFITRATNNDRYGIMQTASTKYIAPDDAMILVESGYIRKTDNLGFYTFTAKGLWLIENAVNGISYERLTDFIDQKFFDVFDAKSISDGRKIILLSMVAMRSFSKNSAINMRTDADVKDKWYEVLLEINDLMIRHGVIQEKNSLRNRKTDDKTEHPASKLMRHTEGLSKDTKSMYNNLSGDNRYYLDLSDNRTVDTERLGELLSMIFENKLNEENYQDIVDIIVPYARTDKGLDFIGSISEDFYSLEYNDCIENAFRIAKHKAESII